MSFPVKSVFIGCITVAIATVLFFSFFNATQPSSLTLAPTQTISVGSTRVHVAIADTEAERELGLSGVTNLASDEGMLFVFPQDGKYSFWMKGMLFSIDMLWISHDGRVVYIVPSASPATFPQAFTPTTPARYVIELPAGFALTHGIQEGSRVAF